MFQEQFSSSEHLPSIVPRPTITSVPESRPDKRFDSQTRSMKVEGDKDMNQDINQTTSIVYKTQTPIAIQDPGYKQDVPRKPVGSSPKLPKIQTDRGFNISFDSPSIPRLEYVDSRPNDPDPDNSLDKAFIKLSMTNPTTQAGVERRPVSSPSASPTSISGGVKSYSPKVGKNDGSLEESPATTSRPTSFSIRRKPINGATGTNVPPSASPVSPTVSYASQSPDGIAEDESRHIIQANHVIETKAIESVKGVSPSHWSALPGKIGTTAEIPSEKSLGHRHACSDGVILESKKASTLASNDSSSEKSREASWKYHILKYYKDMYLTTNPGENHLTKPSATGYYVEVDHFDSPEAKMEFSLKFFQHGAVNPVVTVIKRTRRMGDHYDIAMFDRDASYPWWIGQAVEIDSELPKTGRQFRQYKLHDSQEKEWIVGNRQTPRRPLSASWGEKGGTSGTIGDGGLVGANFNEDMNYHNMPRHKLRIHNSTPEIKNVYFFSRGETGPDSDKVLTVMRRREQLHKRVVKDGLQWVGKKTEAQGVSSEPLGNSHEDDDADNEKVGWLSITESALQTKGLWEIAVAMTLAVSYEQRQEGKDRSLQRRLKDLGRKAYEARMNVYYGNRPNSKP